MPTKDSKDRPLRTRAEDEGTETLPVGHPQAGYVSPDLSEHDQTGTLPPEEKEWHEARNEAHDDEVERVNEGEAKVAKEEREEREKLSDEREGAREKQQQQKPPTPAPKQQATS
jgi:hypothetical protein